MFSKLSSLFGKRAAVESSSPIVQPIQEPISAVQIVSEPTQPNQIISSSNEVSDYAKGINISHDPFTGRARNTEVAQHERIKSKMELYRKLQKELGKHG